jgi:hypothetical protein
MNLVNTRRRISRQAGLVVFRAALVIGVGLIGCAQSDTPAGTAPDRSSGGSAGTSTGSGGSSSGSGAGGSTGSTSATGGSSAAGGSGGSAGATGGSDGTATGGSGSATTGGSSGSATSGGSSGSDDAGSPGTPDAPSGGTADASSGGGSANNPCFTKAIGNDRMLAGLSPEDFCDGYEKYCLYTPDGTMMSKCATGQPVGPLYKDRADCIAKYSAASPGAKACRAGQMCRNGKDGTAMGAMTMGGMKLIVNACSHATGYCAGACK